MLKVGLTGGIGSGKSTVAEKFEELGVHVIDTDAISHQLTETPEVLQRLRQAFGDSIIANHRLDRGQLARLVFSSETEKSRLEAILHPLIRQEVFRQLGHYADEAYVIIAVPLLLETDFHELVDRILVVDIPPELQLQRVSQRDNRSEDQIRRIIATQTDRDSRLRRADDIIDNSNDQSALEPKIAELHRQYSQAS